MKLLIALYALFVLAGHFALKRGRAGRKEALLFYGVTTVGAVLWGSILLGRPLDANKLIALLMRM